MTEREPEFLTVRELAELLRIKERKVYDLAASGRVPVTRVTGKLLFPTQEIRTWIEGTRSSGSEAVERPNVFLGSHDPLLSWAIGQSRCGIASFFDGSLDGLERFRNGEGIAAGVHIHEGPRNGWNIGQVTRECADLNAVLISWATRQRGLVFRREAEGTIRGITDVRGRTVAGRQAESGTDILLGHLLDEAGIARHDVAFTPPSRNETDAVLEVARGAADIAFGLGSVAQQYGLGFVPLVDERFDLLIDRQAYFDPPIQSLLDFSRSAAFAEFAASLGGYEVGTLGTVRWNA